MRGLRFWVAGGVVGAGCLFGPAVRSQPAKAPSPPKLEPVAETKLLMNGIADPNFKGVGKLLKDEPGDAESWEFARARALLVAETGNLLLMRPPKARTAEDSWLAHAGDLRETAAALAKDAAARDYVKARASLAAVANACNRCHHTFRVAARVRPFAEDEK